MKTGIVAAWLAGTGIVVWRSVHADRRIPAPGLLLGISALFIGGAVVADIYPASETLVLAVLVGLDVAALLDVLPAGLGGQISQAQKAEGKALAGTSAGNTAGEGNLGPVLQG